MPRTPTDLFTMLSDRRKWRRSAAPVGGLPDRRGPLQMLGDNSPRTRTAAAGAGRREAGIHRSPEVGRSRALLCIYWPHGKPFGPDIRLRSRFPNPVPALFERMKWIH